MKQRNAGKKEEATFSIISKEKKNAKNYHKPTF